VPISPTHFQEGYLDFMPHRIQMMTQTGPPRTSMLDDLYFYIQRYSNFIDGVEPNPESVLFFAKSIVASHYLQHAEFLRWIISTTQLHISRKANIRLQHFKSEYVETQWSDSQALERRMYEYCEDLEAIMLQCGVAFDRPNLSHMKSWHEVATDFQFLYMKFCDLRHRAESLKTATSRLAGIAGNQQAVREQALSSRETRNMKSLTLLGLIFIPLAFTSSIFSMAQPFGPGGEQFWIYFTVSGPLVLLVLGLFYIITTIK
jgi:CorA-like Mg2+ transporter protein